MHALVHMGDFSLTALELQWGWVQAIQSSGDFEDDFLKVINVANPGDS